MCNLHPTVERVELLYEVSNQILDETWMIKGEHRHGMGYRTDLNQRKGFVTRRI